MPPCIPTPSPTSTTPKNVASETKSSNVTTVMSKGGFTNQNNGSRKSTSPSSSTMNINNQSIQQKRNGSTNRRSNGVVLHKQKPNSNSRDSFSTTNGELKRKSNNSNNNNTKIAEINTSTTQISQHHQESDQSNQTNQNNINDTQITTSNENINMNTSMGMNTAGYGMGMGMMGMGYGGYGGAFGGYGMSPYSSYGMGMGMGMNYMGGSGPLQSLNQFLFSFQTVVFSLGQAMQVLGMNTQALHQLYQQAMTMLDQSLALVHEIKTLENQHTKTLTEEEEKKRRRLKAMRWAIMIGVSYAGYSFVRKWLRKRREYKNFKNGTGGMMLMNEPSRRPYHDEYNYDATAGRRGAYLNSNYGVNDQFYSGGSRYHNTEYGYGNQPSYNGYQPSYSSRSFHGPDYGSSYTY